MRTTIKRAAIGIAAATALLLTGCAGDGGNDDPAAPAAPPASAAPADNGVAALEAEQILERARAALKGVDSYRFQGAMTEDNQPMALDFKTKGKDLIGSLAMGDAKVELLAVGGKQYIRPNETFWGTMGDPQRAKTMSTLLADRWATVPPGEAGMSGLFNAADIGQMLENSGKVIKGPQKDVNGTPAIGLVDEGPDGGTLYIATVGEPYPLRIEPAKAGEGEITFSDFGAAFPEIRAPAEGDVVDMAELAR